MVPVADVLTAELSTVDWNHNLSTFDNSVDLLALKPGDIHHSHGIIDSDHGSGCVGIFAARKLKDPANRSPEGLYTSGPDRLKGHDHMNDKGEKKKGHPWHRVFGKATE